jgi:PAS domain S-box-containing protein
MKAAFRLMKGNKGDIFIGTIHNITKEFLLQAELHQRVQLAESLAENIIDKVLITDSNHTVVLWNKQCEEAFRISKAAALGKNFFDIFPQLNTADQIRLLNKVLEGETIFHPGLRSSWDKTFYNLHMMPVWSEDGTQINGIIHILHDITREMELRNSLSGRLGLIESLVESSLDRIIALDRNMNYLVWNKRCEEYFGLEKATVIGKNLLELFPGAQEEQTYAHFRRALRGEVVFVPAQKNESGNDYYEMYFIPVKDEKGEIIAILWVQHDITKEFLLTQQLGKQNRIYEYAEEITSMGTWSWNMETGKALYSDNMFRLFGLIPNELEPGFDNIPLFIHPEDRQVLLQNAERLKEGLESKDIEYRVTRKDGMQRIFRNRSQLITTEEDKRLVIGTTQDITEEILLRQKLAERQRYAEKLFDAGIDHMFVLNKDFIVQAWNKQCERYYSMSKEQVIGKSYLELFPKKAQDAEIMEAMQACFKGEMTHLPARQEIYLNIITECFYIPLPDEAGEVDSILCVWHDVTKAFHHREELRDMNRTLEEKNKELEEKNEEITTFSFVASHDLKEPLRKLHTFADWLMIHESENISDKGRQFLNRIERSVHRMEMLIDDILVLSRINADKQGHTSVNPVIVLNQVIEELKEAIESSQAAITIHAIPVLNANQNQLFHLFRNLVSNALKFHKENAHPELEISSTIIPSEEIKNPMAKEATEYIKISFSDKGLGFEPRYSKRIFSVFQRLHGRHEFEGTGMGLAICKKIMENHNGFIEAKGEPDKGATFCCYFPVS